MALDRERIREAVERAGLTGRAVVLHSSLRSFGPVEGGPDAVIDAFLDAGCTLIVPTFTYECQTVPPAGAAILQNGVTPEWIASRVNIEGFDPAGVQISRSEMGSIPAQSLLRPERVRGFHPNDSFTGLGPRAAELMAAQTPMDVFGPFKKLHAGPPANLVLAGVGLTAATAIHLAEEFAGRRLFRRGGKLKNGMVMEAAEGGCSEGFENLAPALASLEKRTTVGRSLWRIYPFREFVDAAAAAIRADPTITHCADPHCERCNDAVRGGPILTDPSSGS